MRNLTGIKYTFQILCQNVFLVKILSTAKIYSKTNVQKFKKGFQQACTIMKNS